MNHKDNLKQLSQYGVKEADLHEYFGNDEYAAYCTLNQIERISKNYDDVKNIRLHMANDLLGISFDSDENKTSFSEKNRHLQAVIKQLEVEKRPESLGYDITIFLGSREEHELYYNENRCFELDIIQPQYHFKHLLLQTEPTMSEPDAEYLSDLLTEFSNHPFTACQKMGFNFFRKTTALDVQLRLAQDSLSNIRANNTKQPKE